MQDLSEKVEPAVASGGPAFINALADSPLGWGHEVRIGPRVSSLAVETRLWPLFGVVDGRHRLTCTPAERVPIEERLRPPRRFRHLPAANRHEEVEAIQRHVDRDWELLVSRCEHEAAVAA